jgi:hypothetical protein
VLVASSARRFVRAGRAHLLLVESSEVALVDDTVIVDIEIGSRPGGVRPVAGLGILDGLPRCACRSARRFSNGVPKLA